MSYRVWSRFHAEGNDGSLLQFIIQDLPKSRIDDAADLLMKYFVTEEKLHKAAGIGRNPQAVSECLAMVTETIKDPASWYMMCCEDQGNDKDGQMVGVFGMSKVSIGYEPSKGTKAVSTEIQTLSKLLEAMSINKIMNELRLENFYSRGMVVHPDYRHFGIATQLVNARNLACVENNLPGSGALLTSVVSQKIADKMGCETVHKINLGEIGQQHGVPLDGVAKVMYWKNPQYKQEVW